MKLDIEDIRAFVCVAETMNVSRGSARLDESASSTSDSLKRVDAHFKQPIFERIERGGSAPEIVLTPAGHRILPKMREALQSFDQAGELLEVPPKMPVRIGVNPAVDHAWLFDWLQKLRAAHPRIELDLAVDTTVGLEVRMKKGALDLALCSRPIGEGNVEKRELPSQQFSFVGNQAIHTKALYELADISRYGLISFQSASKPHQALMRVLAEERIKNVRIDLFTSVASMVRAVRRGFGIATLPTVLVERGDDKSDLRVLPCTRKLEALRLWSCWPEDPSSDASRQTIESFSSFASSELVSGSAHPS